LDLKECKSELLDDIEFIRQAMTRAASEAGATIVGETFHKFSPMGVTGILAIAESHLCIHTWPEYGYAAVDIFTCGEEFKPYGAADVLIESLQCEAPVVTEVKRGVIADLSATAV
jgi:S-adenosylmethionine decarboxylase